MIRQLVDGSAIQRELMPLPFNSPRPTEILACCTYILYIYRLYEAFANRVKTDLEYTLFLLQKEDSA